jgi:cysteine desulfurase
LRPGTENVLEIVGLGKACEVAKRDLKQNLLHMSAMRDRLARQITESLDDVRRNGHSEQSLPNTLSLSFFGIEANKLLEQISDHVAASAGAACHSGGVTISSVLKAMRVPEEWAKGTIRLSTGRKTTAQDIDTAANIIINAVKKNRVAR